MKKSRPGETISKLLRRKSSQSLYAVAPPAGRATAAANELEELGKLDNILSAVTSSKGAMNTTVDSGTAKVKQRPTVKLAIPFHERPRIAVPTPTVPDQALFSKIPRTSIITGSDVKYSNNKPNVGNYGQSITVPENPEDDWIPPPPPMAPPPPPIQSTHQNPHMTNLSYEVVVPPPPKMAPPPPPPPNMTSQQKPTSNLQTAYLPPETNFSPPPIMTPPPPPIMTPPPPPIMASQKPLQKDGQFPTTSPPSPPKVPLPLPPPFLPTNDYSLKSPLQDDVTKLNQNKHPKKSPPPPPQRDLVQHNINLPLKPESDTPSSPKFLPTASQISVSNNRSLYTAESPQVISKSSFVSTFNPKATAKLYGFSEPVNGSETSLESDQQNKSKSTIVMQDADQYPMDHTGGSNQNASMHKKVMQDEDTESPGVNKVQIDSVPPKPQKPARKNNLLMQQSKSVQNIGIHPSNSGFSIDEKEKNWINNMNIQQTSSNQTHDSNNSHNFTSSPVSTIDSGIEYGKYKEEERTKSTVTRDFENQSSSENVMSDFQYSKPVEGLVKTATVTAEAPDSSAEQTPPTTEQNFDPRSPLALLMAAKQRDSTKNKLKQQNKGFPKVGAEASSLSLGSTRYIKPTNSNTFQITPKANYKERSLISRAEQEITTQSIHVDDIVSPVKCAEKSLEWSDPSRHSTSHRIAEPEDSQKDDMSLLLIPPPPFFSDEENEDLSFGFLPPPLEFSNRDDVSRDYSSQPERKVNDESGMDNLHAGNSDKRGLSLQGSTYESADYLTSNDHNSLTNRNSYFNNRQPLNSSLLSPVTTSSDWPKPPIAEKPSFINSATVNGGSAKFQNSKQVSGSYNSASHLQSKAYGKSVPKVKQQQTETVPSTNKLAVKNKVIDELQSKVQNLSTGFDHSDIGSKSSQSVQLSQSHGRTFTIRPGTKQPITVVYPPNN
ncbi:uncharacterized protein [Heptranchias perlo]|uniref:uncharacterized protein n=1 Tax=Heptranchias perlo TaxID=212740 RepID=UPI00355A33A0